MAPPSLQRQSRVVESFNFTPFRSAHALYDFSSSLKSHVFASAQSRITVTAEIPKTSAVSSTLRPPKNRSSTILLFRSSKAARVFNASSSAITSGLRLCATIAKSSSEICSTSPPRFSFFRCARNVYQDTAHELCRHRKEMCPTLPTNAPAINQAQIRFIDQRGGLKHMAETFSCHVPVRQSVEFILYQRH